MALPTLVSEVESTVSVSTESPYIHESAIVEPGARLGSGTRVWHHAHVRTGAVIGDDCTIGKNAFVDSGAVVGNGCKIQNNVSVYSGVFLEDSVFVGPSVVFTNDLHPRADSATWVVVPTRVETGASIGANATIICGVTIGSYALVAAGSVVAKSVPDYALVMGNPAKQRGWVCRCGKPVDGERLGEPCRHSLEGQA